MNLYIVQRAVTSRGTQSKDKTRPNQTKPMVYLQRCAERRGCENHAAEHVLATVDIKDAFLCVPQAKPFAVTLAGRKYIIAKNLPGQRLGAKAWYWFFRDFLSKVFGYEWCTEQPYLCRNEHSALMLHVDDVLFVGKRKFGKNSSCQS